MIIIPWNIMDELWFTHIQNKRQYKLWSDSLGLERGDALLYQTSVYMNYTRIISNSLDFISSFSKDFNALKEVLIKSRKL